MVRSAQSGRQAFARYDFRASSGQPRPHLRTLVRMHEVLVDRLGPLLSRQLRCEVDVELAATELATFDEYVRSMPLVTVVSTFKMFPLDGRCAVEMNPQLATVMVERMLGGPGTMPQMRRLSDVEASVLEELTEGFREGIASTFSPLLDLQPKFSGLLFDPEFLDVAEGQDTVILLAYRINLRAEEVVTEGVMTVCYPTSMLAPVLRQLSDAVLDDDDDEQPRPAGPFAQLLPDVEVPVTVRLNPTTMRARDLAGLAPGDVLRLSHRLEEPAIAHAGGSELFRGHLGQRRRNLGMQVTSVRAGSPNAPSSPSTELATPADEPSTQLEHQQ